MRIFKIDDNTFHELKKAASDSIAISTVKAFLNKGNGGHTEWHQDYNSSESIKSVIDSGDFPKSVKSKRDWAVHVIRGEVDEHSDHIDKRCTIIPLLISGKPTLKVGDKDYSLNEKRFYIFDDSANHELQLESKDSLNIFLIGDPPR